MTFMELFSQLSSRGLTVVRNGDDLECRGDLSTVTPQIVESLKEHRNEFLSLLPQAMTQEQVGDALDNLRDSLNREVPDDYLISCNEEFWSDFEKQTEAAIAARDPKMFESLKTDAAAEFAAFNWSLKGPCESCGNTPWWNCGCCFQPAESRINA